MTLIEWFEDITTMLGNGTIFGVEACIARWYLEFLSARWPNKSDIAATGIQRVYTAQTQVTLFF